MLVSFVPILRNLRLMKLSVIYVYLCAIVRARERTNPSQLIIYEAPPVSLKKS